MELPPAMRFGDHLALDFLNSVATPKVETLDWIGTGEQLLDWMESFGLLTAEERVEVKAHSKAAELESVAGEARELREWFRGVLKAGAVARNEEVARRLNALLERDESHRRIESEFADGHRVVTVRRWRQAGVLVAAIAEQMADLVCEGDFAMVRKCENPACTMWFYDRTKGHRRRWCSQAICGNRAKVAAFRERQKAGG